MKNSIFNSFRFKIVLYSLLSLLYTIITEAFIFLVGFVLKRFLSSSESPKELYMNPALKDSLYNNQILPETYSNSYILNQGAGSNRQMHLIFIGVTALIIGIVLFIMYFLILTRRFTLYLEEITAGVNEISEGNFNARIDIKNEDEFSQIAGQINKMADDVKRIMEQERKNESSKNELIVSVAHDLRTPLTSIIGYLDLVRNGNEQNIETKKKYIRIAYEKAKRLEKLIEDLFAFTKFSFGEVAMNFQSIDMVQFIEQLLEEFYPSFQEYNLEYEFVSDVSKAEVRADGDLLVRAFANIIGNAVKYGKDGKKIKIHLGNREGKVYVSIINYGEIIPTGDINSIFERFYRVESSRSSETGGVGLGLAIAKNIVMMHNGSITARSDYQGTVFEVSLNVLADEQAKVEVDQ